MSVVASHNTASGLARYRDLLEAQRVPSPAWAEFRRTALQRFMDLGFPTQRDEAWKYTNLRRLESRQFLPSAPSPAAIDDARWIENAGARIVLVNGHHAAALSNASPQPPGVTILTLGQWLQHNPAEVVEYLQRHRHETAGAFEHLNEAFCADGVVINVAPDTIAEQPVYVVHQWNGVGPAQMSHPRIIVHAGRNSRCSLIEHYLGHGDAEHFTNAAVTIEADVGAQVHHQRIQHEASRSFHVSTLQARLQQDARYVLHDIALGASLGRTSIGAALTGRGASARLYGLFIPAGSQHLDTHVQLDHRAPHTASVQDYRGIADGRGRGIYNGKVLVREGAQKIDSRQSSRNLLLSPTAEIDTRPELEIYADDVKCSHGATTGQLDTSSLFYLRSRGLSEAAARALLIRAFADSVLATLTRQQVRTALEQWLDERFAAPGSVS